MLATQRTNVFAENENAFVEVAVPLHVRQTFTYRLPMTWRRDVRLGARLLVPFGRKQLTGYAVALHNELDPAAEIEESSIKDAVELLDANPLLTPEVLELTRWVADYYSAPWGEILKAALPAGINSTVEQILCITQEGKDELTKLPAGKLKTIKANALRFIALENSVALRELGKQIGESQAAKASRELEKSGWIRIEHRSRTAATKAKRRKFVGLLSPEHHASQDAAKNLTPIQQRIIQTLIEADGEISFTDLLEKANVSASTIQTLEKKGIVGIFVQEVRRDPLANAEFPEVNDLVLTDFQVDALRQIEEPLSKGEYATFLLHGVTGSGKTEIYIRAMREALSVGKTAMMLVPEIALTPVFSRRLRTHFGDEVAIFHSSLTAGERFDEWRRLKSGEARVVIGTRSAIFAPVENLGIIIIDEEHETSYRQQESPYYHGRDAAIVRARKANAVCVLGSATPSLETYNNAQTNKYRYIRLSNRVNNRSLAEAEIIDMRKVFAAEGKSVVISPALVKAIEETHERKEQSIILLNRRGYSTFVLCRKCGESIRCTNCDVTLTYHRTESSLVCHYCNLRQRAPKVCPQCQSPHIYYVGEGTEQIEEILRKRFPQLRIARVDRDSMSKRKVFEQALLSFSAGELDMLVGTQMLAKGHDFPNVTLVGVVSVDAGLALPDFRSAERTFQLITQVAGRAGRGDRGGRVLIQTYHPEHYAITHACAQDYKSFFDEEIRHRKNFGFPPFVALASLLVHHEDYAKALDTANTLRDCLDAANIERHVRILGPAPAPLARLKNEHRLQILIKAKSRTRLRETIDFATAEAEAKGCEMRFVNLEIDPINLM
jgi:primosomal protein N' (replication factor Y)